MTSSTKHIKVPSYPEPQGLEFKAGQSWNKQHGYVQTEAGMCDVEALKAAYNAAGRPALRTWVKEQAGKGVAVPSYPTCMSWFKLDDGKVVAGSFAVGASSSTAFSFAQEFEAKFEAEKKAAYIEFLHGKANDLRAQLAAVEGEITKLTSDPVVEG
ncbi:hypothetical protein ATI02_5990 [Pseudomonas baetica]|uniref:DUF4376 domain-containing protein n=1 Tax=Pseudomonas baetica TaxID=674054 RepID=A0ABX4Q7V4_9PSED|nr:hypothetical protein [Pseudomonas baetica]PKA72889.1 hypothetical protein ATI02_5990 [Pseudomonas baetica]PTC19041.1 hypothetical protein C0J26_11410 [Pseudomonas baetica]